MKRTFFLIVLVLLLGMQLFRPDRTNPPEDANRTLFAVTTVPPDVARILQVSCLDCHSHRTDWPWYSNVAPVSWMLADHVSEGRHEMNFSTWADLDANRAQKLLGEICEEVEEGAMPEPTYLWMHRDARLSEQEKAALCAWAAAQRSQLLPQDEDQEP
jgi:hypothetical protein